MKRPSFQFYPEAWQTNANLKRCSKALKCTWLDVMCLMHDSDEYGVLRWPLREVAEAAGCKTAELKELRDKTVLKGADIGEACQAFIYTPRHAGKDGEPVVLIPEQPGPVWYSSRMVRDEYLRSKRGTGTRFGDDTKEEKRSPTHTPTQREGDPPDPPPIHREGDGALSLSLALPNPLPPPPGGGVPDGTPAVAIPDCPHQRIIELYHELMPLNPRVLEWTDTRKGHLRARWREKALPNGRTQGYTSVDAGIAFWRRFFAYCAESKFLTGRAESKPGKPPFCPNLDWLLKSENFAKVIEGNYIDR